ncbi:Hypothetical_protein [Hexamita inflata]|uniref:Hypothetical_protein n=1 Tax=Hexamita inflata TaxID=28002 RepID=A0ABP1JA73_9EUKA
MIRRNVANEGQLHKFITVKHYRITRYRLEYDHSANNMAVLKVILKPNKYRSEFNISTEIQEISNCSATRKIVSIFESYKQYNIRYSRFKSQIGQWMVYVIQILREFEMKLNQQQTAYRNDSCFVSLYKQSAIALQTSRPKNRSLATQFPNHVATIICESIAVHARSKIQFHASLPELVSSDLNRASTLPTTSNQTEFQNYSFKKKHQYWPPSKSAQIAIDNRPLLQIVRSNHQSMALLAHQNSNRCSKVSLMNSQSYEFSCLPLALIGCIIQSSGSCYACKDNPSSSTYVLRAVIAVTKQGNRQALVEQITQLPYADSITYIACFTSSTSHSELY